MFSGAHPTHLFQILNAKDISQVSDTTASFINQNLPTIKYKYPKYFSFPKRYNLLLASLDALVALSFCVDVWWSIATYNIPPTILFPLSIGMAAFTAILIPLIFIESYVSRRKDEQLTKEKLQFLGIKEAAADELLLRFKEENFIVPPPIFQPSLNGPSIKKIIGETVGIFGIVYLSCYSGISDIFLYLQYQNIQAGMVSTANLILASLFALVFGIFRGYLSYKIQQIKHEAKVSELITIEAISAKQGACEAYKKRKIQEHTYESDFGVSPELAPPKPKPSKTSKFNCCFWSKAPDDQGVYEVSSQQSSSRRLSSC